MHDGVIISVWNKDLQPSYKEKGTVGLCFENKDQECVRSNYHPFPLCTTKGEVGI